MVQKFSAPFSNQEKWYRNFPHRFLTSENGTEIFCTIFQPRKMVQKFSTSFFDLRKWYRNFLHRFLTRKNARKIFCNLNQG